MRGLALLLLLGGALGLRVEEENAAVREVNLGLEAAVGPVSAGANLGAGLHSGLTAGANLGPIASNANLGLQGGGLGANVGPLGLGLNAGLGHGGFGFHGGLGLGNYAAYGTPQHFQQVYGPRPWYHPLALFNRHAMPPPAMAHGMRPEMNDDQRKVNLGLNAAFGPINAGANVGAGLYDGLSTGVHLGPVAANTNLGLQGGGIGANLGPLGLGLHSGIGNGGSSLGFGGGLGFGNYASYGTPQYFSQIYGARPWYHPLAILGKHKKTDERGLLNFNLGASVGQLNGGVHAGAGLYDGLSVGTNLGWGAHPDALAAANANIGLQGGGVGANLGPVGLGLDAGIGNGGSSLGFNGGLGVGNYAAYGTPQHFQQAYGPRPWYHPLSVLG